MVDGPNVYAYVVNNPVAMWDALGKSAWTSFLSGFGGHSGDMFDKIAEFSGRCVGAMAVFLLLGTWLYFPGVVLLETLGAAGIGLGTVSVAQAYPTFAATYTGVWAAASAFLDLFYVVDSFFDALTDMAMGSNEDYSCTKVLKKALGIREGTPAAAEVEKMLSCSG